MTTRCQRFTCSSEAVRFFVVSGEPKHGDGLLSFCANHAREFVGHGDVPTFVREISLEDALIWEVQNG